MTIALVITAKNEERILRNNLIYHYYLGISRCFVYLDGSTDGTRKSLEGLDFVTVSDSIDVNKYESIKHLQQFVDTYETHHTARQCLNTYDAKMKCRDFGIDWLISIDSDELIALDMNKFIPNSLPLFFKEVDKDFDEVNFRVFEVFPRKKEYGNVFAEESFFKTHWKFKNRCISITKNFYNPFTESYFKHSYWYGQGQGKSAIRVSSDLVPRTVHRYIRTSEGNHKAMNVNYLLHYHVYDAVDFIKKFKNMSKHPSTHVSGGAVESIKLFWKDLVNSDALSEEEKISYFEKYIMFSKVEIERIFHRKSLMYRLLRQPVGFLEIKSIKAFYAYRNSNEETK